MKVLIACEESQTVCKAFRAKGHEAFSCDIQECSGGQPEWHYQEDVFEVIEKYGPWDLMIAFPPCTHIANAGEVYEDGGVDIFYSGNPKIRYKKTGLECQAEILDTNKLTIRIL